MIFKAAVRWIHSKVEKWKDAGKAERKTVNHTGAKRSLRLQTWRSWRRPGAVSSLPPGEGDLFSHWRGTPSWAGPEGSRFHTGAPYTRERQTLLEHNCPSAHVRTHNTFFQVSPHLSELSLSQFFLEDEALARQLRQRAGIGPWAGGGQGGHGVGVVPADTLQAHDVCLSVMRDTGRQRGGHGGRQGRVRRGAGVGRRLLLSRGETLLHVHVQTTGWREETDRVDEMKIYAGRRTVWLKKQIIFALRQSVSEQIRWYQKFRQVFRQLVMKGSSGFRGIWFDINRGGKSP